MKDITKTRLNLIIAKAQLLLAEEQPWHKDAYSAAVEISNESGKILREIAEDHAWRNGDR